MHVPAHAWYVLGAAGIKGALSLRAAALRRRVRKEFVALLNERHPEVEVLRLTTNELLCRLPGMDCAVLRLRNLYGEVSKARTRERRQDVMEQYATALQGMSAAARETLSLETHGERLFPMLAQRRVRKDLAAPEGMPFTPLESLDLEILYVIERESSFDYVGERQRRDLGLGTHGLYECCLENLRKRFPPERIREQLARGSHTVVFAQDAFTATRLLLLPEALDPGQMAAAMIPDRDTFAFWPADERTDWEELRGSYVAGSTHVLVSCPVRVTMRGFERM